MSLFKRREEPKPNIEPTPIRLAHTEVKALYDWVFMHRTNNATNYPDTIRIKQSSASGIGVKSVAECSCGAKVDITDYSKW